MTTKKKRKSRRLHRSILSASLQKCQRNCLALTKSLSKRRSKYLEGNFYRK